MADSSVETLKTAVQALYRVHAVEGPPGENGLRTVWHLCPDGAELLSLVDSDGRVQRQELTLLEDHYIWASGQGVRTGSLERSGGGNRAAPAVVVKADPQLVPQRLLRAAMAMGTYTGQDRYILHMQRVLALAREGLEMAEGVTLFHGAQRPSEPTLPAVPPAEAPAPAPVQLAFGKPLPDEVPPPVVRKSEGLVMLAVLALGVLVGLGMLVLILLG
ncbi:hypothetical protein HPC49_36625 [Pyxidicoccus fallax]|uniref:Uncharacterized protein n=1 Tax=Pyxidicoccus fallax TaxID=394095 RepID=A0A848LBF1_9BACT|nr:hypothetical protein [Pyxidicoccus fallax]NPC83732.1 hypothetical protein [Pyxidicoccus fallax]